MRHAAVTSPSAACGGAALLIALALGALPAAAQQLVRVTDLNTTPIGVSSNPSSFTAVGTKTFFVAFTLADGAELWLTDGTPAGTLAVASIAPGPASSQPIRLTALGPKLLFAAHDDAFGYEPYVSDGTAPGTSRLADLCSGPADGVLATSSGASAVTASLWTFAGVTDAGVPVCFSDGTPAGTTCVTARLGGSVNRMATAGGFTYVTSYGKDANGFFLELWRTDGTGAGTVKLTQLGAPYTSFTPDPSLTMAVVGPTAFFVGYDQTHGAELWSVTGSDAGLVADLASGTTDALHPPFHLAAMGSRVYFSVTDFNPDYGRLFTSDGTAAGTYALGPNLVFPQAFTPVGGLLFYRGTPPNAGVELWRSDGTDAGTFVVADLLPGLGSSNPSQLTAFGATLLFTATTDAGTELWASAGTAATTRLVKDINPGPGSSTAAELAVSNGLLYFSADDGVHGREPWVSDGTTAGTTLLADVEPALRTASSLLPALDGGAPPLVGFGPYVYFAADDGVRGSELWRSDGTDAGTSLVFDLAAGPQGSFPFNLAACSRGLIFGVHAPGNVREVWTSDGTAVGTTRLATLGPFDSTDGPVPIAEAAGGYFFLANAGTTGLEPWFTDWTPAGTQLLLNLDRQSTSTSLTEVHVLGGNRLFFLASSPSYLAFQPWVSDGTSFGTQALGGGAQPLQVFPDAWGRATLPPFAASSVVSGALVFYVSVNNRILWTTDGTPGRTASVAIAPTISGPLTPVDGGVVFPAYDSFTGILWYDAVTGSKSGNSELWFSDGTASGTHLLRDITPGNMGSNPRVLGVLDGRAVFAATQQTTLGSLQQPWVTDGTTAGTFALVPPGMALNPMVQPVVGQAPGAVYFSALSATGQQTLWRTDGTTAGTVAVGPYCTSACVGGGDGPPSVLTGQLAFFHMQSLLELSGRATGRMPDAGIIAYADAPEGRLTAVLGPVSWRNLLYFAGTTPDGDQELWVLPGVPHLVPRLTGSAGADASYYRTAVSASFVPDDALTSLGGPQCGPVALTADTPGTTLTCSATSPGGATTASTVVRIDTKPPTVSCPPPPSPGIAVSPAPVTMTYDAGGVVASDAQGPVTVTCDSPATAAYPVGTTNVQCTAIDQAGNAMSCTIPIQVVDPDPPLLTCPLDVTITVGPDDDAGVASWPPPQVTDAVDPSPFVNSSLDAGALLPVGQYIVTVTAQDHAGNVATPCDFIVTVARTAPPLTLLCPKVVLGTAFDDAGVVVDYPPLLARTDDGSPASVTAVPPSGSFFPLGSTPVSASATDSRGDDAGCRFVVQVGEVQALTVLCPADPQLFADAKDHAVLGDHGVFASTYDNRPATLTLAPPSGTVLGLGPTPVTATATDAAGRTASCTFTAFVQRPPEAAGPARSRYAFGCASAPGGAGAVLVALAVAALSGSRRRRGLVVAAGVLGMAASSPARAPEFVTNSEKSRSG